MGEKLIIPIKNRFLLPSPRAKAGDIDNATNIITRIFCDLALRFT